MLIAIIDDDEIHQFLCKKLITRICSSCQILAFANGLIAYEFFRDFSSQPECLPDLILLDINMPSMNGWQFLEALRSVQLNYTPYIYLVSSSLDELDTDRAMAFAELTGFQIKPLSEQRVIEILLSVS